jgi:HupE / UreJ protein
MSELFAFIALGFHHIADPAALDHLLFLFALAAIYRGRDWRSVVWVVTAFTAGHSATLALAVTGAVVLPTDLIEFLIPLTILATGVENLLLRDRGAWTTRGRSRPVLAGLFGLVHGAGFANYLRSLFTGSIAMPLLGFNLGIELGQLVILAGAAVMFAAMDQLVGHRPRLVAVSAVVVLIALPMAVSRLPW